MPESAPPAAASAAAPETASDTIPEGYRPLHHGGPYFRALGAIYIRPHADGRGGVVALRIAPHHLNVQGVTHGGMLTTVADGALGINIAMARGRRQAQVTVSLTADFLSGARVGEWLEAHVTVTRMGRNLAYANCDLRVGERHVLRSSAVFAFVDRPLPAARGGADPPLQDG